MVLLRYTIEHLATRYVMYLCFLGLPRPRPELFLCEANFWMALYDSYLLVFMPSIILYPYVPVGSVTCF